MDTNLCRRPPSCSRHLCSFRRGEGKESRIVATPPNEHIVVFSLPFACKFNKLHATCQLFNLSGVCSCVFTLDRQFPAATSLHSTFNEAISFPLLPLPPSLCLQISIVSTDDDLSWSSGSFCFLRQHIALRGASSFPCRRLSVAAAALTVRPHAFWSALWPAEMMAGRNVIYYVNTTMNYVS